MINLVVSIYSETSLPNCTQPFVVCKLRSYCDTLSSEQIRVSN